MEQLEKKNRSGDPGESWQDYANGVIIGITLSRHTVKNALQYCHKKKLFLNNWY